MLRTVNYLPTIVYFNLLRKFVQHSITCQPIRQNQNIDHAQLEQESTKLQHKFRITIITNSSTFGSVFNKALHLNHSFIVLNV